MIYIIKGKPQIVLENSLRKGGLSVVSPTSYVNIEALYKFPFQQKIVVSLFIFSCYFIANGRLILRIIKISNLIYQKYRQAYLYIIILTRIKVIVI